jgi:hypothetical protein
MKNYFLGCLILIISACTTNSEPSSGFVNLSSDKFQIGSDKTVDLFKDFI